MKKLVFGLLAVFVLIGAGSLFLAGRAPGPTIALAKPDTSLGSAAELDLTVSAPRGELGELTAIIEQAGRRIPLFTLGAPANATVRQESADRIRVNRRFTRRDVPELVAGPARIVVSASRSVLFGLRSVSTTLAREVNVVFEPPKVSVVSTHHYINHGGSELVVYRATPPDVESGVLVGDRFYPGYPIPGEAGAKDPSIRVAFFALLYDQDLGTAIDVLARDAAGNEAKAEFEHRVFAKKFRKSRLELDEAFLSRVVPPILERSPELGAVEAAEGDLLTPFLKVNGELRRQNAEKAATFAAMTAPEMLWEGAFSALGGAQVESSFADYRTYVYQGKEVDRQVHLGADLASTANAPVRAANRGKVVFTGYLGIYGECVVLDHGMGLQSMYAHLSSTAVAVGDVVSRNQEIGRTGTTGLAGGDHLHFAVLLQGHEVAPAEWWDPHWIEDRVIRKLKSVAP